MTTKEAIQLHIRSLRREIDDLEQTKIAMVNETAREAIDLHIENLRREIRRLEEGHDSYQTRKTFIPEKDAPDNEGSLA